MILIIVEGSQSFFAHAYRIWYDEKISNHQEVSSCQRKLPNSIRHGSEKCAITFDGFLL